MGVTHKYGDCNCRSQCLQLVSAEICYCCAIIGRGFAHMGIHQLKSGKWRAQVRRKGIYPLDQVFSSREEAEAAVVACTRPGSKLTLREAWKCFEESSKFHVYAENTKITYRSQIKSALEKLGNKSLEELETAPWLVAQHFDKRCKSAGNGKRRLEIAVLGSFAAWAKDRKIVKTNFMRDIERPATPPRTRRVFDTETASLTKIQEKGLNSGKPHLEKHARFQIAVISIGCRPGELASAKPEDIDFAKNSLSVSGKTGYRVVHLTATAKYVLSEQLKSKESGPFIFNRRGGQAYDWKGGVSQLKKHKIVSKGYHSHAGRREFISRAIENGIELTMLKKQTGHKSTQALELYDQSVAAPIALRKQLDKLENVQQHEIFSGLIKQLNLNDDELESLLAKLASR